MSSFSKSPQLQATNAVNSLLGNLLPGATKISTMSNKRRLKSSKGSKAQLIDINLRKRVEIQEKDVSRIKKKEKKLRKQVLKTRKKANDQLEQSAKLQILESHKQNGVLTIKEKKFLNNVMRRNVSNAKSWDLDVDDKEDLQEVQEYILDNTLASKNAARSQKRRKRTKQFKEEIRGKQPSGSDHRYPGLTPGLAPVGLSDEEESSDEE